MRLLVLIAVEMGSLLALCRLGSLTFLRTPGLDPPAWRLWLAMTPAQDALASVLRLAATGCAWWLLATTGVYVAARMTRVRGLVRATAWTTPRAVRRLIDRSLALSMVATLAGGTAAFAASGAPPAPVPVVALVGGHSPQPFPVAPVPPAASPAAGRTDRHQVKPGDNLWTIAGAHLADNGAPRSNGRIAPYWERVVQENRTGLRSGNPDLIFPGETVSLPPVT
jgi:hypothetical protein